MWHALGQVLDKERIEILNIEQDLGLPGPAVLRSSNLRPIAQLKKYAIELNEGSKYE